MSYNDNFNIMDSNFKYLIDDGIDYIKNSLTIPLQEKMPNLSMMVDKMFDYLSHNVDKIEYGYLFASLALALETVHLFNTSKILFKNVGKEIDSINDKFIGLEKNIASIREDYVTLAKLFNQNVYDVEMCKMFMDDTIKCLNMICEIRINIQEIIESVKYRSNWIEFITYCGSIITIGTSMFAVGSIMKGIMRKTLTVVMISGLCGISSLLASHLLSKEGVDKLDELKILEQRCQTNETYVQKIKSYLNQKVTQMCNNEKYLRESERILCVVCMERRKDIVFIPCGHVCCCSECSVPTNNLCPICSTEVEKSHKIYITDLVTIQ